MTTEQQRIWDLPTRLFHWSLVICIVFAWWSAEYGDLLWHKRCGYVLLTLILFRILWGFVGSTTSRFSDFVRGPKAVIQYALTLFQKKSPATPSDNSSHTPHIGHNPLGGWSVIILLLMILGQICLGLIAEDVDGLDSGPLAHLVSYDVGRWAAKTHETIFDILVIIIGIHIAAAFFYLFYKKTNLITPMITGKLSDSETASTSSSTDSNINSDINTHSKPVTFAPLWLALLLLAISGTAVWWMTTI